MALLLFTAILVGCGSGSNGSAPRTCENPVEFSNQPDATTFGFLVGIHTNIEANAEAVRLMEKYADLEVYSVFSSINGFHANSGEATIENLKCESSVQSLHYNNAIGIN